jgi:tetraacyldisaccharide 4'-kinase
MLNARWHSGYVDLVSGRRRGPGAVAGRVLLRLAAGPYAVAVAARNAAFDLRLRPITRVPVPVISVGNLTAGGTGKTPLVVYLAKRLCALGVRPAVVSRGYGGRDETDLLGRLLPDVPQAVNPDRVAGAREVISRHQVQCVILDDGFQHRRLARDLDIVTVDALRPLGYGHLLPRGLLREPVRALRRADLIVVTRCDQAENLPLLRARLTRAAPGIPRCEARHEVVGLVAADGASEPAALLCGRRIVAVSGIGNPEAFRRTLADLGPEVLETFVFPDHHAYSDEDRERIYGAAERHAAEAVATTQKDLAKLVGRRPPPRATFAVQVQLALESGSDILEARLQEVIERAKRV